MMKPNAALRKDEEVLSLSPSNRNSVELAKVNQYAESVSMDLGFTVEDVATKVAMSAIAKPKELDGDSVNMFLSKNMEAQEPTPEVETQQVQKKVKVRSLRQILKAYNKGREVTDLELDKLADSQQAPTTKVVDASGKTVPNLRKLEAKRRDEESRKEAAKARAKKTKELRQEAESLAAFEVTKLAEAEEAKLEKKRLNGTSLKSQKQKRKALKAAKALERKAAKEADIVAAQLALDSATSTEEAIETEVAPVVAIVEVVKPITATSPPVAATVEPELVKESALDQRESSTVKGEIVSRIEEAGYQDALLDERKAPFTNLLPKGQHAFWTNVMCEDGIVRRAQMIGELVTADSIAEARDRTLEQRYNSKRATSSPEVNAANEKKIKSLVMEAVKASVVDIGIHPKHISNAIAEVQSNSEILDGFMDTGQRSVTFGPIVENAKEQLHLQREEEEIKLNLVDSSPASPRLADLSDLDERIAAMHAAPAKHTSPEDAMQEMFLLQEAQGQIQANNIESFATMGEMSLLVLLTKPQGTPGRRQAIRETVTRRRAETKLKINKAIFEGELKSSVWMEQARASDAIARNSKGFKIVEPTATDSVFTKVAARLDFATAKAELDNLLAALSVAEHRPTPMDVIMLAIHSSYDSGGIERTTLGTIAGVERDDERLSDWFSAKFEDKYADCHQDYIAERLDKVSAKSKVLMWEHGKKVANSEHQHIMQVTGRDVVSTANIIRVKSVMNKLRDPAAWRKDKIKLKRTFLKVGTHLQARLDQASKSDDDTTTHRSATDVKGTASARSVVIEDVSMDSPFIMDMYAIPEDRHTTDDFASKVMSGLKINPRKVYENFTKIAGGTILVPNYCL